MSDLNTAMERFESAEWEVILLNASDVVTQSVPGEVVLPTVQV